ncbi:MAG: VOC family protein [Endozoicomonas sp.]
MHLTHIALHVADLGACQAFYENICGMQTIHTRENNGSKVHWLALPGEEERFVLVLISGGQIIKPRANDYSHLGFALSSKDDVDQLADAARASGSLIWEPVSEPFPVGYYCGVRDPNGNNVEFSYGQPLGLGANGDKTGQVEDFKSEATR